MFLGGGTRHLAPADNESNAESPCRATAGAVQAGDPACVERNLGQDVVHPICACTSDLPSGPLTSNRVYRSSSRAENRCVSNNYSREVVSS
jgi:hypothetical protein